MEEHQHCKDSQHHQQEHQHYREEEQQEQQEQRQQRQYPQDHHGHDKDPQQPQHEESQNPRSNSTPQQPNRPRQPFDGLFDRLFAAAFLAGMRASIWTWCFIVFWFLIPVVIIFILGTIWNFIVALFHWVAELRGRQLLCVLLLYALVVPSLREAVSSAWEVVVGYAKVNVWKAWTRIFG
ncbi:MAG: hypothetical protein L6R41_006718 [Letrouitia leprolyta]|nr:MAG: hypothetical protein L6R41_006718 [Letrouitia leprolyta]